MDNQPHRPIGAAARWVARLSVILIVFGLVTATASAQTLIGVDDSYGVPFADTLVVEEPGVMTNDTYGGAPAADAGATVTLLTYPNDGAIDCESDPVPYDLCPDGSFTYTPGSSFSGFDSFTYEVALSGQTSQATVTLSACTGGPAVYVCWQESAYLARLGALGGYDLIQEGFENDTVWGVTRDPLTEPSVVSQGVRWESNHPDPPASNELITGPGPARTGLWGLYDPEHGYATGTPTECDITVPPEYCLFKDGFTGTREPGETMLYGAGGYLKGSAQPNLSMYLDGGARIGLGLLGVGGHQFFGVIDTGGFSSFRIEETDGKVGQERYVFGDDFIFATTTADTTPPQVTLVNSWYDTGDGVLAEGEITDTAIFQLLISFSEPVRDVGGNTDPHDVTNPANYLLVSDGGNGFETVSCSGGVAGNDIQIAVDWVTWESSPVMTATLDLNGGVDLAEGSYRLLVCGTTSIHDWVGNALDGNGNGVGGDDFERNFTIYYPPNDPPTANPQSVSTPEDTGLLIVLTGSDPNLDPLTYSIVTGPSHGGLTGVPPTVTYTPALNYHGPDSFTFRVFDGALYSDPAAVSITVTPVNDVPLAVDDSATTDEDVGVSIAVLVNDALGDPPTTITAVTQGTNGAVTIDPGATTVTYTPDPGTNGADSFTYTITDLDLETSIATVSMTVTPVNNTPLAVDDSATTDEDTAISIPVLTNDDLGDEPTTITAVTQGTKGAVAIDPGATSVTYTPNLDTNGGDSFTYTITDADLETSTATVSMTVNPINDVPLAVDDSASTDEDVGVSIAVLTNDALGDPPTTITAVTQGTKGAVAIDPGATSVTYTPNLDTNGADSFTYTITDADLETSIATVSMTVTPVNDPPTADDQSVSTAEDTGLLIVLTGGDVDGDGLTFVLGTGPTHGLLTGTPPAVTYTPDADYHGPDSFTFTATDGVLTSPAATVSITATPVNDVPLAVDDSASTDEDVGVSIAVLTNDALGDPPTTITAVTQGTSGTVAIDPGATTVTYTPDPNFHGGDNFTYTITDLDLETSIATVSMTVNPINDTPLAVDDSSTTDEDVAISINVLTNDALGDEPTTITSVTQGTKGAVAIDPGATSVTYTPNLDTNGLDSFSYTITDADFETSMATVSMTVTAVNDAPTADAGPDQTALVTDTVTLDGSGSSDVDGDPLTHAWTFSSVPPGSTTSLSDPTAVMPTFEIDLPGDYVVELIVDDGALPSAPDTVTISTTNSAPVADAGPDQAAFVTDTVNLDGSGSSDVDGDPLTYAWSFSSVPPGSAAALSDPTAIMPTFVVDLSGAYVVELIVWDGTVFSTPDTVTISTENSAPVADAGPDQSALVTDTVTLDGSGSFDVDGDPLTFAWSFSSVPPGSAAALSDPTAIMPTFVVDLPGAYVVQLIVWDGTVFSAPDTVTISTDNSPPVADPQTVSTAEDTGLGIVLTGSDPDGDPITFAIGTGPTNGVLTGTLPNMTYTPGSNYHGPDSFTYTATDGVLTSAVATVSITVTPVNDVPLAVDDSASTDEDTAISIAVLGNDALGDPPTTITSVTQGTSGSVAIDPGATTVTYTPDPNFHGGDNFTYTITDLDLETSIATVSMTVNPVNDVPLAVDDSSTSDEDVAISINVLTNDDLGDEPTTITSVTQGTKGAVAIDPGATSVTYTPNLDTNGLDSFTYTITDADLETSMATVSMTVTAVNDAPTADAGPDQTALVTDTVTLDGSGSSDVDGDPLTYAWSFTSVPPGSAASLSDPTAVMPTFVVDLSGSYVVQLIVHDGAVPSAPDTVTITVTPMADPVLTVGDASLIEPDAGTIGVAVTITVSEASPSDITVDFATADDSALAGLDYVAASGTIIIPALATSHDVMLDIFGDALDEPDEAFTVNLATPVGATLGSPSTATVTIFDNDPMAELSAVDLTVGEAVGTAEVALQLDGPSGFEITVEYNTVDGTASAPGDYGAVSGTATITSGSTSTNVSIPIVDDAEVESEEGFTLDLSLPNNAVLLTPSIQVTILDDDGCAIPGDADGNCLLDAADLSLIITIIDDPSVPALGDADCDANGAVDGWDLACVAASMVAQ